VVTGHALNLQGLFACHFGAFRLLLVSRRRGKT
jgi:hypothetical protein